MQQEAASIAFMAVMIGLPIAAWAHISLFLENERRIKNCGECATCKGKWADQEKLRRENNARMNRMCVRGHGSLKEGRCRTCGWS